MQAQTSGDNNNTSRTVYPYYKNLHMGVINNQHENNTTPAAQLPALPSQPKNSQGFRGINSKLKRYFQKLHSKIETWARPLQNNRIHQRFHILKLNLA